MFLHRQSSATGALDMKLFTFVIIAVLLSGSACNMTNLTGIRGSGNAKTETRNLSGFKGIKAGGAVKLEVAVQKDFGVTVETDDNLLEYITTEVSGDTLIIGSKDRISPTLISVKVSMPELTGLDVSGATTAMVNGAKTDSLKLEASGASKVKIDGEVKTLEIDASGASGIDAENLLAENAQAEASGASSSIVNASNQVEAIASGASTVTYMGNPTNITQNSSGASTIKKR